MTEQVTAILALRLRKRGLALPTDKEYKEERVALIARYQALLLKELKRTDSLLRRYADEEANDDEVLQSGTTRNEGGAGG